MGILQILDIQDDHNTEIILNDSIVHTIKGWYQIQVEKWFIERFKENNLSLLVRLQPELLEYKGDTTTDLNQVVDLPMQLINLLILGISVKAHSIGLLTIDPRTGTPYNINPYIERYQLEFKKALDFGYLPAQTTNLRNVETKYFV